MDKSGNNYRFIPRNDPSAQLASPTYGSPDWAVGVGTPTHSFNHEFQFPSRPRRPSPRFGNSRNSFRFSSPRGARRQGHGFPMQRPKFTDMGVEAYIHSSMTEDPWAELENMFQLVPIDGSKEIGNPTPVRDALTPSEDKGPPCTDEKNDDHPPPD